METDDMKFEIAPSLLSADFGFLVRDIKAVEADCRYLHLDVMDGHYVNNIAIGVPVIASIRKYTDLIFDTHLMIDNPEKYVEAFAMAGSNIITFHIECTDDPVGLVGKIRNLGCKAGIAIHPDTPIEALYPYVDACDLLLVMSVVPGFGGQGYLESSDERIAALASKIKETGSNAILSVDGGIKTTTIKRAYDAGARLLVAGSAVFGKENPGEAVRELKFCITQ